MSRLKRIGAFLMALLMTISLLSVYEPMEVQAANTYTSGVYTTTTETQLVISESGFYRITTAGGTGAYTYGYNNCPEGSNIETHYDRATPGGDGTIQSCVAYIEAGTTLTLKPNSIAGSAGQENSVYADTSGYAYKWGGTLSNSYGKYRITARSGTGGYGSAVSVGGTTVMVSKGGNGAMSPFGYVNCGYMRGTGSDPGPGYANGRTFQTSPVNVGCRTFTPYMPGGAGGGTDTFIDNKTLKNTLGLSFEWVEGTLVTGNVAGTNTTVTKNGYVSVEKIPPTGGDTTYTVRHWLVDDGKAIYNTQDGTLISSATYNCIEYDSILTEKYVDNHLGVFIQAQVGNNVVRQTYALPNGERYVDLYYKLASIECEDYEIDAYGRYNLLQVNAAKKYHIGDIARGSDWGTTSPYSGLEYYEDTSVLVEIEDIPESAFDTSGVRSGKTEIITQFDQENFSADAIMSTWDMYPNPNMFVVHQGYIANVVWNYQNGYSIEKIPHDASHIGFNQSFIYADSYGSPHNVLETKVNLHACCAASGLVINYNPATDIAYLALFCNTTGYGGVNSGYNTKSAIVKVTNFSKIAIKGTAYTTAKDPMYCGTHLVTVNSADIGIPLRAPFDAMQNPASEFKVKIDHDNTTGNVDVYVNDQLAMNTTLPTNLGGGIGLFAGCNGGFHDVNMDIQTTYTQKTNVLYINPNGGEYSGYTEPVGIAGKTITVATPTREGYEFIGWVKGKDFKGDLSADETKYTFVESNGETGYIDCLVAKWIPKSVRRYFAKGYFVEFDGNGADGGTVSTMLCFLTKTYNMPANGYAKKGYDFLYWNTEPDGTGTTYTEGQSFVNLANIGEKVTLYAIWKPIEYDIYYDKGLTSDITHSAVVGATRNTNIQSVVISNRPYTHAIYDSNVQMATLGDTTLLERVEGNHIIRYPKNNDVLLGRRYEITFNGNYPTENQVIKASYDLEDYDITGTLPSAGYWVISGQDSDVTMNLSPYMGSTITQPNYTQYAR